jgi:cyclophilin family peptidyl-prolyl cis-trans isomerase
MNQTTWIVGGGALIVATAVMFYFFSGDGIPKNVVTSPIVANPETMLQPATSTGDTNEPVVPVVKSETVPVSETTPTPEPKTEAVAPAPKPASVSNEVLLKTSMGNITLKLYRSDAPKTVENFTKLAKEGFYNGVRFHRVIKGFMIQTGDPLSKDDSMAGRWGTGGPGYKFADEINASSAIYQRGYKHGVLAMANSGPNTNGSQFFIMHNDYPLPPLYTIFGEVTSGLDVVDAIGNVAASNDRPLTPVSILSMEVK